MSDNGYSVNFETQGDGPPVILIHGMGASLRQWDYLMPQLATAGFSAYALDLQGHGDSPKPRGAESYHIEVLYDQLTHWIENLQMESPAILVGHSLGGYLSLIYALRNHKKVHSLVLVDPFYSPLQLSPIIRYFAKNPRFGIRFLDLLPTRLLDFTFFWGEKVQQVLPEPIRHQLAIDFKRASPLFLYVTRTLRDLTPLLPRIQHPALVMWGSQDMTLKPSSFHRITAALPEVESYIFPGCGHIPHFNAVNHF